MAAALLAWAGCVRGRPADSVVFADDLTRGPAREWKWIGGNWGLKEERLQQNGSGPADPKKAILIFGKPEEVSTDVVITAKVRIDSWAAGSDSRVGLTVCSDPSPPSRWPQLRGPPLLRPSRSRLVLSKITTCQALHSDLP